MKVEDHPLPSVKVLFYLNTGHWKTIMQMMKDNRHFNTNQMQKSINRSFEVIELNVDEPIMFQKGKWRRRLFERKKTGRQRDKDGKTKIMLVIPR
jgi:hypothetical protein